MSAKSVSPDQTVRMHRLISVCAGQSVLRLISIWRGSLAVGKVGHKVYDADFLYLCSKPRKKLRRLFAFALFVLTFIR